MEIMKSYITDESGAIKSVVIDFKTFRKIEERFMPYLKIQSGQISRGRISRSCWLPWAPTWPRAEAHACVYI